MKYILIYILIFLSVNGQLSAQNLLKAVDIKYKVRVINPNGDMTFSSILEMNETNLFTLKAGSEWHAIQPVGLIENVSDKILTFKVKFELYNLDSSRSVIKRQVPVSEECLSITEGSGIICANDSNIKVRYCKAVLKNGRYEIQYLPFPGGENLTGIPPGGFAEITFPHFQANEFIDFHIGKCRASFISFPVNPLTNKPIGEKDFSDDTLTTNFEIVYKNCAELLYPNNGDTITPKDNFIVGTGKFELSKSYNLEFSKEENFNTIDFTASGNSSKNYNFDQHSKYFWRLKGNFAGSSCYSETRYFYTGTASGVDYEELDKVNIYPNPAADYIIINKLINISSLNNANSILIFDIFGRSVAGLISFENTDKEVRINISRLQNGVYALKIYNKILKFLKN